MRIKDWLMLMSGIKVKDYIVFGGQMLLLLFAGLILMCFWGVIYFYILKFIIELIQFVGVLLNGK